MDAIQVTASAVDLVRTMVLAVQALNQASRDMQDAPQKVQTLEGILNQLTQFLIAARERYGNRIHHQELDIQLSSLDALLKKIRPQVKTAKKVAKRKGVKLVVGVMWASVVGDQLTKITDSMMLQLNQWIAVQKITTDIQRTLEKTASRCTSILRVQTDVNYPTSRKVKILRQLLDGQDQPRVILRSGIGMSRLEAEVPADRPKTISDGALESLDGRNKHRVILLHGLSGIGKSCLARQVAADPPKRFSEGAVELVLGQWCSRAACGDNNAEYQKRLAVKICRLLHKLGRKREEVEGVGLEDACWMLQGTLEGKNLLIVLDDVWEPDIIDRFVKLYDNNCKYLATTRNEAVHEITGAVKVEITKEDTRDLSKAILMFHSQLSESELPHTAVTLINRCGHHPLTLAVMGKALRGETRPEQWEKALDDLHLYAAQAPVPVSYLNEKEAQNAATVFGSFEFSLEVMDSYARVFFTALAALCWVEPIPEACLEAVWAALSQDSTFKLTAGKLIERSLLGKASADVLYQVHDMVALYLESRRLAALNMLLIDQEPKRCAVVAPWLFVFGNKQVQKAAENKLKEALHESWAGLTLLTIVDVLSASKSISELEATSVNFSCVVGPEVPTLLLMESEDLTAAITRFIANCFTMSDYVDYSKRLQNAGLIDKVATLLKRHPDVVVQTDAVMVLTRLTELRSMGIGREVFSKMPVKELIQLLDPAVEERQDCVLNALMSLAKAGKQEAIDQMFMFGMDRKLVALLGGSEAAQSRAVVVLKSFHELGGSYIVSRFLKSAGNLKSLPWQVRLILERLTRFERIPSMPSRYSLDQLVGELTDGSARQQIEAMQNLLPIIEKVDNPEVREMILQAYVVENLAKQLQIDSADNSIKSEAAFALMKLGCSGGEICINRMLKVKVVESLVGMMSKSCKELQDTAYSALHNLVGAGKLLITDRILSSGQLEKIVALLQYMSLDSKEMGVQCIQDLVEFGGKACIERLLALQVVEKLAVLAQSNRRFKDVVINFVKGVEKGQGLSGAERRVFRQQLVRKVKASVKDINQVASIMAILQGSSEGSSRSGSSHSGSSRGSSSYRQASGTFSMAG